MSGLKILMIVEWVRSGGSRWFRGKRQRCSNAWHPSYLCPTQRNAGCGARKKYSFPTLMLYNAKSNNKTYVLQNYLMEQN